MSWSVSAIGKPGAVAAKLSADFAAQKCAEPEESVRQAAAATIAAAIAAQNPKSCIRVVASGSQSNTYGTDGKADGVQNDLAVRVEVIYGFTE